MISATFTCFYIYSPEKKLALLKKLFFFLLVYVRNDKKEVTHFQAVNVDCMWVDLVCANISMEYAFFRKCATAPSHENQNESSNFC